MEAECSSSSSGYDGSYTAQYSPPYSQQDPTAPTVVDHSSILLPPPTQYPGDLQSAFVYTQGNNPDEDSKKEAATDWEDPARSWLALVRAFQEKNPLHISRMIRLAKTSPWTPISFENMLAEGGFALDKSDFVDDLIVPETLPDPHTERLERESDSDGDGILEQDSDDAILW